MYIERYASDKQCARLMHPHVQHASKKRIQQNPRAMSTIGGLSLGSLTQKHAKMTVTELEMCVALRTSDPQCASLVHLHIDHQVKKRIQNNPHAIGRIGGSQEASPRTDTCMNDLSRAGDVCSAMQQRTTMRKPDAPIRPECLTRMNPEGPTCHGHNWRSQYCLSISLVWADCLRWCIR